MCTSLNIGKVQTKTPLRVFFIPVRMAKVIFKTTNAGSDMGETESAFLGGRNGNWAATVEISVEIDLPHDQAILLLGIVPDLSTSHYSAILAHPFPLQHSTQ